MANDNLPYISKRETKIASSGQVILEKSLTVQEENLKECERIFNQKWNKKGDDSDDF